MDNDDAPVGRVLTRREVIALFGSAGALALLACADDDLLTASPTTSAGSPSAGTAISTGTAAATAAAAQPTGTAAVALPQCIVRPEQTEGPYFVDEGINRSDIRSDPATGKVSEGVVLNLAFNVSSISGGACSALAGAMVDVWQCDALGVYSDVQDWATTAGRRAPWWTRPRRSGAARSSRARSSARPATCARTRDSTRASRWGTTARSARRASSCRACGSTRSRRSSRARSSTGTSSGSRGSPRA